MVAAVGAPYVHRVPRAVGGERWVGAVVAVGDNHDASGHSEFHPAFVTRTIGHCAGLALVVVRRIVDEVAPGGSAVHMCPDTCSQAAMSGIVVVLRAIGENKHFEVNLAVAHGVGVIVGCINEEGGAVSLCGLHCSRLH